MRQGVVHIIRAHLVQGWIPDVVLFRKQVCQELYRREESSVDEAEVKYVDFPRHADLADVFTSYKGY